MALKTYTTAELLKQAKSVAIGCNNVIDLERKSGENLPIVSSTCNIEKLGVAWRRG